MKNKSIDSNIQAFEHAFPFRQEVLDKFYYDTMSE